jgi:hypothetical protein
VKLRTALLGAVLAACLSTPSPGNGVVDQVNGLLC